MKNASTGIKHSTVASRNKKVSQIKPQGSALAEMSTCQQTMQHISVCL